MRNVSSWISKFPTVWRHFEPITSIRVNYSNISYNESSAEEFTQKSEASINEVKLLGRVADDPALSQDNRFVMFSLKTKAWSRSDSDEKDVNQRLNRSCEAVFLQKLNGSMSLTGFYKLSQVFGVATTPMGGFALYVAKYRRNKRAE